MPPALQGALATASAWLADTAPGAVLRADSRRICPGDVFFAYDGAYIDDAIGRGARAVLLDGPVVVPHEAQTVPHLACPGLRQIAGPLASRHYGQPDRDMFTVAVTGTNGKTSCTQWLGDALSRNGERTAVIGTFGVGVFEGGRSLGFDMTGYTTPDAVQLQGALARVRDDGARALAIEASSIGLQEHRMLGLHVDVALFTNLTRDHLDYHGDMAAYEAAKTALFDWPGLRHAVINLDDPMGLRLVAHLRMNAPQVRIAGYTLSAPADDAGTGLAAVLGAADTCLFATDIRGSNAGTQFQLHVAHAQTDAQRIKSQVRTQLVGDFNVSNVLGVLGVLLARGTTLPAALASIESLQSVAGRMQQIGGVDQPLVVIDYAHTPDALEKTLASLRQVANGRQGALWCVFGCGGDRDPGKRPQMGAISQAADHVIVTSDNPRNELPAAIIADIVAGIPDTRVPQVIEDRATAILWALRHAAKSDVILLAGKGHENYQEIKGRKLQFLDSDHAALALAARATMKGPC